MTRPFDIAFSYAGEQRDYVIRLDAALQNHFPTQRIFYDRRYEPEFAGADVDVKLYEIYRNQAEIVVVLISADYARKNWTNVEGKAIKDLMLHQEDARVVLLRFDQAVVRPIPDTAHFIDVHVTPVEAVADHILARHGRVVDHPPGPGRGRTEATARPRSSEFTSIGTLFKGREEDMERLRVSLRQETSRATAIVAQHAIHGEGGVGKSRLAIEFGLQHEADYSALLFVQADSPGILQANLAALAGPLVLDLGLPPDANAEVRLAEVLKWLDRHPGWFLILDNVDNEEAAQAVEEQLGRLRAGHVVITSRIGRWSGSVEPLELDVLSEAASVEFLLEATARHGSAGRTVRPQDDAQARLLANEVDGLALALEQSASYIRTSGTTIEAYRKRWAESDEKVRDWHDPRLMKYPRSVATTWQSSFDALPERAAGLLRICALLAPAPIPVELLDAVCDDLDADRAPLLTYSLARRDESGKNTRVHRLIQEIVARRMEEGDRHAAVAALHAALPGIMPEAPQTNIAGWPLWERLAPHVPVVAEHLGRAGIPNADQLLNSAGLFLHTQARHAEAEPLMRRALEIAEDSQGQSYPSIAVYLNNLSRLLQDTNRYAEAESLIRRGLDVAHASYGEEHPNVAAALNTLALLLQATNRLTEAEPLMRRALAIDEASHGEDHPDVAIRLNNLAQLLQATSRLAEAEPLLRRALAINESSHGGEHPNVAKNLSNLGQLLQATNRLTEAEPLMRRALEIDEASFGKDHPDVARDLNNLAQLLQNTNRRTEAEPLMRRALEIDEASYGRDHPEVATDLSNLATLLYATTRLAEAEPLMRRALAIDETSYGKDHPKLAIRLGNLALLLKSTNRLAEAEPLMRRQVEIFLKFTVSTGHPHPRLQAALANYAILLGATGLSKPDIQERINALLGEYGLSLSD